MVSCLVTWVPVSKKEKLFLANVGRHLVMLDKLNRMNSSIPKREREQAGGMQRRYHQLLVVKVVS